MNLPTMRTRHEFYKMLKEHDPNTAITPHMIYQKIRSGEFPSVTVGRKKLLNVDLIFSILASPQPQSDTEPLQYGKIRKIYG